MKVSCFIPLVQSYRILPVCHMSVLVCPPLKLHQVRLSTAQDSRLTLGWEFINSWIYCCLAIYILTCPWGYCWLWVLLSFQGGLIGWFLVLLVADFKGILHFKNIFFFRYALIFTRFNGANEKKYIF